MTPRRSRHGGGRMSTGTDHARAGEATGQTLLILGATGDLAERLLLPGLGALLASGRVRDLSLVGSATEDWDDERWRRRVAESFAAAEGSGPDVDAAVRAACYVRADATSDRDLRAL